MNEVTKMLEMTRRANLSGLAAGVAPPSFAPPPPRHVDDRHLDLVAASLASGIIAGTGMDSAGGMPVTAEEAVRVFIEVRETLSASARTE